MQRICNKNGARSSGEFTLTLSIVTLAVMLIGTIIGTRTSQTIQNKAQANCPYRSTMVVYEQTTGQNKRDIIVRAEKNGDFARISRVYNADTKATIVNDPKSFAAGAQVMENYTPDPLPDYFKGAHSAITLTYPKEVYNIISVSCEGDACPARFDTNPREVIDGILLDCNRRVVYKWQLEKKDTSMPFPTATPTPTPTDTTECRFESHLELRDENDKIYENLLGFSWSSILQKDGVTQPTESGRVPEGGPATVLWRLALIPPSKKDALATVFVYMPNKYTPAFNEVNRSFFCEDNGGAICDKVEARFGFTRNSIIADKIPIICNGYLKYGWRVKSSDPTPTPTITPTPTPDCSYHTTLEIRDERNRLLTDPTGFSWTRSYSRGRPGVESGSLSRATPGKF